MDLAGVEPASAKPISVRLYVRSPSQSYGQLRATPKRHLHQVEFWSSQDPIAVLSAISRQPVSPGVLPTFTSPPYGNPSGRRQPMRLLGILRRVDLDVPVCPVWPGCTQRTPSIPRRNQNKPKTLVFEPSDAFRVFLLSESRSRWCVCARKPRITAEGQRQDLNLQDCGYQGSRPFHHQPRRPGCPTPVASTIPPRCPFVRGTAGACLRSPGKVYRTTPRTKPTYALPRRQSTGTLSLIAYFKIMPR